MVDRRMKKHYPIKQFLSPRPPTIIQHKNLRKWPNNKNEPPVYD